MKRGVLVFLLTLLLAFPLVAEGGAQEVVAPVFEEVGAREVVAPDVRAPRAVDTAGATRFGLMAETNFGSLGGAGLGRVLLGFKIKTANLGITPKMGLGLLTGSNIDTAVQFDIGCGVDYYVPGWRVGNLMPYVGGDLILGVFSADDTGVTVTIYPHIGAEYRLSRNFSLGGNVGPDFTAFASHPVTGGGGFGFGFNGVLQLMYYFK